MAKRLTKDQKDEVRELLGEAFHTAFRKASDHPEADKAWKAIKALPPQDWANVLDFVRECL